MANSEHDDGRWVDERLEALAPGGFDPDVAAARARLRDRESRSTSGPRVLWVAAAAVCLVAVLLPWPRAAAQRLWDRLMLSHVEVVSVQRPDVPPHVMAFFQMEEQEPMVFEPVATLAEAQRMAGFRASLPAEGVLAGAPALAVVRSARIGTAPMRVDELRALLARMGVTDLEVPADWENAALTVESGPMVVADYPEAGVEVMQAGPLRLTMPPGFALERFMEIAFRVFGRNAEEARRFGGRVAANPPLLMVLTPGHDAVVREIVFDRGTGALVGSPDGGGMCLFLNLPGRVYFISADRLTEEQALAIARSLE